MSHSERPATAGYEQTAGGQAPGAAGRGVDPTGSQIASASWWQQTVSRDNAWRPVLVKGLSVAVAMIGLAAIGVISARASDEAPTPGAPVNAQVTTSWLAGASLSQEAPARQSAAGHPAQKPPEPPPSSKPPPEPAAPKVQTGVTADGKVIINLANEQELTLLPGIGKKRAEKIITLRRKLKRFRKTTDLLRIRGIGIKTLRKMLPHLVLDAPQVKP